MRDADTGWGSGEAPAGAGAFFVGHRARRNSKADIDELRGKLSNSTEALKVAGDRIAHLEQSIRS